MSDSRYNMEAQQGDQGDRIDIFVVRSLEGVSRSHVQKLIASGQVLVQGRPVKANYKIQSGDHIDICVPAAEPVQIVAEPVPLDVLYEDNDIIVINKARGMVVHPAAGNYSGTLVNALLSHCDDLSGINGEIRPGIVHRLDKDTSGVIVAAKNDRAHLSLAEQIRLKTAVRKYYAIVHGNVKEEQGIIEAPIGRHPTERKKMAVVFTNSKEATTKFRVVKRYGSYTLVECTLLTGRTHQIRVHMAYIGNPIAGDPVYGPKKQHFNIKGQALHAAELSFFHPVTGELLIFTAPMPDDMNQILSILESGK